MSAGGIFVVSVRRTEDPEVLRAAAYAHVGLAVDAVDQDQTRVAVSFTDAGFTVGDLIGLIEGLHGLRTTPHAVGANGSRVFRDGDGVDSEGRATDVFMLSYGTDGEPGDWLVCAEAAHATWPRLLDTLGVSIGGTVLAPGTEKPRSVAMPAQRTPKALRLKSGWDYDAEGNQVWLPLEEAWRRFVAHNEARPHRDSYMDAATLMLMREHMEGFYAKRAAGAQAGAHAGAHSGAQA